MSSHVFYMQTSLTISLRFKVMLTARLTLRHFCDILWIPLQGTPSTREIETTCDVHASKQGIWIKRSQLDHWEGLRHGLRIYCNWDKFAMSSLLSLLLPHLFKFKCKLFTCCPQGRWSLNSFITFLAAHNKRHFLILSSAKYYALPETVFLFVFIVAVDFSLRKDS